MGFSWQVYWGGLPFPLPGGLTWQLWANELGQTLEDSEGQRSVACYSPWGREESDMAR